MKYNLSITQSARSDLIDIFEYIAYELLVPETAANQLRRLETAISSLSDFPFRFRSLDREKWRNKDVHIMPVDNFVVLYVPNTETQTVTVLRVMYGGRDIANVLQH